MLKTLLASLLFIASLTPTTASADPVPADSQPTWYTVTGVAKLDDKLVVDQSLQHTQEGTFLLWTSPGRQPSGWVTHGSDVYTTLDANHYKTLGDTQKVWGVASGEEVWAGQVTVVLLSQVQSPEFWSGLVADVTPEAQEDGSSVFRFKTNELSVTKTGALSLKGATQATSVVVEKDPSGSVDTVQLATKLKDSTVSTLDLSYAYDSQTFTPPADITVLPAAQYRNLDISADNKDSITKAASVITKKSRKATFSKTEFSKLISAAVRSANKTTGGKTKAAIKGVTATLTATDPWRGGSPFEKTFVLKDRKVSSYASSMRTVQARRQSPVKVTVAPGVDVLGNIRNTLLQALSLETPKPSCEGKAAAGNGVTWSVVSTATTWMCLETDGDKLTLTATPNTAIPAVLRVSEKPNTFRTVAPNSTDAAVVAVSQRMMENQILLIPGATTTLVWNNPTANIDVATRNAPQLYLTTVLAETGSVLLGVSGVKLMEKISKLDCATEILSNYQDTTQANGAMYAAIWKDFFACAEQAAKSLGTELSVAQDIVFSIVSTGPTLLIAGVLGAVQEVTGQAIQTTTVEGDFEEPSEFAAYVGTWTGPITQPSSNTPYSVVLRLFETKTGALRGEVRYPELNNCGGYWNNPRLRDGKLLMTEHIIYNSSRCSDEVPLSLTANPDGTLYVDYRSGGAWGTLTKQPTAIKHYLGTWTGPITQPSSGTDYSIVVQLYESENNQVLAEVSYPELKCGGYWDAARTVKGGLQMTEHITYNTARCTQTGSVSLVFNSVNQTMYMEYASQKGTSYSAWGTLRRQPPQ